jgi:hypothetical protein
MRLYYHPKSICFTGIVKTMSKILNRNNIQNEIVHTIDDNDELFIIFWPNCDQKLPKNCIIYNFDPMVEHVQKELLGLIGNRKDITIWDYCYSQKNFDVLKRYNYEIIPYGLSESNILQETGRKDIDVLFYGGLNQRRSILFNKLRNECKGVKFCFRIGNLYDDIERKMLINRAKIVISVASNDAKEYGTNDLARLSEVIANKTFILCESIGDPMFESLSGIIFVKDIENLSKYVHYYLDRPEREKINQQVYNNCKKYFNFDKDLISCINRYLESHIHSTLQN